MFLDNMQKKREKKLSSFKFDEVTELNKNGEIVYKDDFRKKLDTKTFEQIQEISILEKKTLTTLLMIKITMGIAIALGLVLIIGAIILLFMNLNSGASTKIGETITMITGGVFSEAIGVYLYIPLRKLISSEADIVQQMIIMKSWSLLVLLQLIGMNINDKQTVINAANEISEKTKNHIAWIQQYVEEDSDESKKKDEKKTEK